jgi:hypothetical protein
VLAGPVSVRSYRYPPAIKDEIERQVSEMLQSKIIQPSSSPFSLSVLSVKKKTTASVFVLIFDTSMQLQQRSNILCQ